MPQVKRIDQMAAECNSLPSEMDFEYRDVAPSIEFSNTGRRGGQKKYFSITILELLNTLRDIQDNLGDYESSKIYDETTMRNLFSRTIKTGTVNALSTVQTLPLFSLLNKVIYVSNGLSATFHEKQMNLDKKLIANAISFIEGQV